MIVFLQESTSVAESGIDHEISSCRGTVNHLRTENSQLQKEIKQLQVCIYVCKRHTVCRLKCVLNFNYKLGVTVEKVLHICQRILSFILFH